MAKYTNSANPAFRAGWRLAGCLFYQAESFSGMRCLVNRVTVFLRVISEHCVAILKAFHKSQYANEKQRCD